MIVVDTDVIIWVLRNDANIVARFERAVMETDGRLLITPIQLAEIYAGIRKNEEKKVADFMANFGMIEITNAVGIRAGRYLNDYKKSHGISLADAMICAAAVENAHAVWTLNRKHYPMLKEDMFATY